MSFVELTGPLDDELISDLVDYLTDKVDSSDTLDDDKAILKCLTVLRDCVRDLCFELEDRISEQEDYELTDEDEGPRYSDDDSGQDEDDESEDSEEDQW